MIKAHPQHKFIKILVDLAVLYDIVKRWRREIECDG